MTDQPKPTPGPNKHVFIPPPPTEAEQMAWSVADSSAQVCRQLQQRVDALSVLLAEATEALEQYALRTNQQIDAITQKLDTLTADNQRLRELLVECIEWVPSLDLECNRYDLYDRINNAIGRTGE